MQKTEEGAKPQLTIVGTDSTKTGVLPELQQDHASYADMLSDIITCLTKRHIAKQPFDAYATLALLDINEDNSALRDWLTANSIMTKAHFDKLMKRIARDARVKAAIGFVPKDAEDFVRGYAERENITLTPAGVLKRSRAFKIGTEEINRYNCDTSTETRLAYDVANAEGANIDSYGRDMRLLSAKYDLGYRDSVISDAIASWQEETTRKLKVEAMLLIQYQKGRATGEAGQAMWAAMEAACFDVTDTAPGFPTAVIKKFMWQVKRKARGMEVTNHLMPVLTGPQGKGKTQFVLAMTRPLEHFKREVDFQLITDGKTADIWNSLILFIDEMGFAKKADVDIVKNAITAEARSIRAMRQNHSAPVQNHSTLIGCSNKSLGQLFRDETGGRRFAELAWTLNPDWDALNAVDWTLLWQSVDEAAKDPIVTADFIELLGQQQEENRNQHPVEVWVRENAKNFPKWEPASSLHETYRLWEQVAFPRDNTNQIIFGRIMNDLIQNRADFPMEKKRGSKSTVYRFKDNDND